MLSDKFKEMKQQGKMKDDFHYFQVAYNEVGDDAGYHAAKYIIHNIN